MSEIIAPLWILVITAALVWIFKTIRTAVITYKSTKKKVNSIKEKYGK